MRRLFFFFKVLFYVCKETLLNVCAVEELDVFVFEVLLNLVVKITDVAKPKVLCLVSAHVV